MAGANDKLPLVVNGPCGYDNPYFEPPPPYVCPSAPMDDTPSVVPPSLQPLQPPLYDQVMEESERRNHQLQRPLVVGVNSTSVFVGRSMGGAQRPRPLVGFCGLSNESLSRFLLRLIFAASIFNSIVGLIVAISFLRGSTIELFHLCIPLLAAAVLIPGAAMAYCEMKEEGRNTAGLSFLIKSMYVYMVIIGLYSAGLVGARIEAIYRFDQIKIEWFSALIVALLAVLATVAEMRKVLLDYRLGVRRRRVNGIEQ
ncbi:hypothetical protein PFISCL1PPCAC_24531 [Pristionchus fissidentatus]|uniref:Uncharacterized protein n=1 Tax=Pristionchus fissidentatus TaxID=1538716 RepID=A0AAV5WU63_9BILA|nr:hypothetical protein PFISCL1PPCAC_24531 [Pristionchus fissidentatus]